VALGEHPLAQRHLVADAIPGDTRTHDTGGTLDPKRYGKRLSLLVEARLWAISVKGSKVNDPRL
jgi:hypothetical protein